MITKPRKSNEIDGSYIAECFAGERIYGDDFDSDALQDWFASESGAYQALGSDSAEAGESGSYPYHALNNWHGFRHLGTKNFKSVLCLGGGDAEEITDAGILAVSITVVEPLTPSVVEDEGGSSRAGVRYVSATAEGDLDLEDDSIDLITCFGTLHHIANVSYVLTEMARCLRPGGTVLIREPVVSMGDWRKQRPGLTDRERGIPATLLCDAIEGAGLEIFRAVPCIFAPIMRLERVTQRSLISRRIVVILDSWISRLSNWNRHYRSGNILQKIAPTNYAIVARKPG